MRVRSTLLAPAVLAAIACSGRSPGAIPCSADRDCPVGEYCGPGSQCATCLVDERCGPTCATCDTGDHCAPDGWCEHRRVVEVDNLAGPLALSDYPVPVRVDAEALQARGKLRPDCSNLRFLDADGARPLSHWLEGTCATSLARAWVKVPRVPARGVAQVFLSAGSPDQTPTSGEAVFDFFADWESAAADDPVGAEGFQRGAVPPGDWVLRAGAGNRWVENTPAPETFALLVRLKTQGVAFGADVRRGPEDAANLFGPGIVVGGLVGGEASLRCAGGVAVRTLGTWNPGADPAAPALAVGIWHRLEIRLLAGGAEFWVDGRALGPREALETAPSGNPTFGLDSSLGAAGQTAFKNGFDNVFIRRLADPEPVVTVR